MRQTHVHASCQRNEYHCIARELAEKLGGVGGGERDAEVHTKKLAEVDASLQ